LVAERALRDAAYLRISNLAAM